MIWEWQTNCIYREVVGVGGFPYLLSLLVLLYSKATDNFDPALTLVKSGFLDPDFKLLCLVLWLHSSFPYHLCPTLPVTLERVLIIFTSYWMCVRSSSRCKYCSEPYSVFFWVHLVQDHCGIHVCDNYVDELPLLMVLNICQYPYQSPYIDANVWQSLYFPSKPVWSSRKTLPCFWTRTIVCFRLHRNHAYSIFRRRTVEIICLGIIWYPLCLEY